MRHAGAVTVANLVLQFVRVLVWPVVVGLCVVLFKGKVRDLLDRLTSFAGAGFNAKFERDARDALATAQSALKQQDAVSEGNEPTGTSQQAESKDEDESVVDTLRVVASRSPNAAVLGAWRLIELKMFEAAELVQEPNLARKPPLPPSQLVVVLGRAGLAPLAVESINDLRRLRNDAAHSSKEVTARTADDYVTSALLVVRLLDRFIDDHKEALTAAMTGPAASDSASRG